MKRMITVALACLIVTMACNIGGPVGPEEPLRTDGNGENGGSTESGESAGLTSGQQTEEPPDPQSITIGGSEDIPDDVPEQLFFGGFGVVSGAFGCYGVDTLPGTVEVFQYPSGQATKRNCFCSETSPGVGQVPATLTLPEEAGIYCAEFDYSFDSGMIMGTHTIEMNLSGNAITYDFMPVPGYLFSGYQPDEAVRLLLFTDGFGGAFIGERFVNADDDGNVYLQLTPDSTWPVLGGEPEKNDNTQYPAIVAFGDTTSCKIISPGYALNPNLLDCNIELDEDEGIFILENPILENPIFVPIPLPLPVIIDGWFPCKDTYASRLQVGDIAYPPYDPPKKSSVYGKPDQNTTPIGQIVSGEKVEVLDGPECANGMVWWLISSFGQNLKGWTSEGDEQGYWLVPSE
jgi:hypothetical protein